MKRSPSPTSSSTAGDSSPVPSSSKKTKISSNKTTSGTRVGTGSGAGIWTAEKRAILVEELMMAGMEHVDKTALAEKLEVTKKQLAHQLEPNRSNIRKRIMDWARGGTLDKA